MEELILPYTILTNNKQASRLLTFSEHNSAEHEILVTINIFKIVKINDILWFKSSKSIIYPVKQMSKWHVNIYEPDKFHAQLC